MHVIPQSWSHLHILISVFPSVGLLLVLGVYIAGFRTGNDFVRRTCLFVFAMVGLLVGLLVFRYFYGPVENFATNLLLR